MNIPSQRRPALSCSRDAIHSLDEQDYKRDDNLASPRLVHTFDAHHCSTWTWGGIGDAEREVAKWRCRRSNAGSHVGSLQGVMLWLPSMLLSLFPSGGVLLKAQTAFLSHLIQLPLLFCVKLCTSNCTKQYHFLLGKLLIHISIVLSQIKCKKNFLK